MRETKATARRLRVRAILGGTGCVHPGSVHDPISARIAEQLGFEMGILAGSVASLAVLGAPDIIVLTLSEFADQARRIGRAADLPLLVDADHGYGNALNVMRTVQELETAGIAGLTIEDTALPAPYGGGAQLLPIEEGVGKIAAALAARDDPSLVVAARTSAISISGIEDAVARARAYAALGPDALFFTGVTTLGQIDALAAASGLPIILGGVPAALLSDPAALAARRVRICLQGHQPFMASVRAVHDTLKALRDGVAPADLTGLAPATLMNAVTRDADYRDWAAKFLGA